MELFIYCYILPNACNKWWNIIYVYLSYDIASESKIKPCIKNDNPLVD